MAPVKFGLFKTRSRDHQEQPSTENLLQNSASSEQAIDNDDASTSCDANSIQFDETPITPSVLRPMDKSLAVLYMKKKKNGRKNLLSGSSNHDEQIKWEAIATARGLCTLTDNCTCVDCTRAKYLTGVADGDGGLGAAPLFSAIGFGCSIQ
ncbi:hypothetical protein MSG28_015187 [Choristoneura fumiferana]|uniref:Uncharacterized protein n=1 Tax=Choristoneura fumiferana TaxID=7141 RepID=A0ACC0KZ68_CHOFU|nr:hypothetical protein MSG28_015187 [Choristoneura fumiferana]